MERNGEFNRGELCTLEEQTIPASCETALSSNKRENEPLCKSVREPVQGADNTFSENLRVTLLPPHSPLSPPVPLLLLLLLPLLPSPFSSNQSQELPPSHPSPLQPHPGAVPTLVPRGPKAAARH